MEIKEENLRKVLSAWSVSDEEQKSLFEDLANLDKTEEPKEDVSVETAKEGGEPSAEETENIAETTEEPKEGGEPTKATEEVEAKDKKILELENKVKDLTDTLEGQTASLKRIEELLGSLGTEVKGKQAPYGGINGSREREADKSTEASAKATMSSFAKMAGKR